MEGRPPIFATPEELEDKINAFYVSDPILTITGLAHYLGFESRQSIYDYKEKGQFSYIIKRALLFIESNYEKKLSGTTPTGPIFALKNMGWKDKTETEMSGHIENRQIVYESSPTNEPIKD